MDGLECSEVALSDLERTHRIDAEFYRKEAIKITNMVTRRSCKPLTDMVTVSDGNHMTISDKFIEVGISYYRGQDIKTFFIENSNPICIDAGSFNAPYMKRSHLNKGDILLSIVGTIGSLALVYSDKQSTCSCKLAILRPKAGVKAEVVATFLRSKYGQVQIKKLTRGAVQMGLILEDMEQLNVPVYTDTFQQTIQNIIVSAFNLENTSKQIYSYAEQLLLDELDMTNFVPSTEKATVKSFSDSFGTSGRLDAEYYQTKYEQIEKALFKPQYVEQCCKLFDTNYTPNEKTKYKYIELSNIGIEGGISNVDTIIGIELPSRARRQVKVGQVIISSIEGALNSCAIVTKEYHNALCSTGFYVIESDSINSETLLILFKSSPIQSLMKKRCSGTILTAISKEEFLHLPLPTISLKTQNEIAVKVQESFLLRKKSKELLERAIQAVEMAIEKDEQTAMDWLSNLK